MSSKKINNIAWTCTPLKNSLETFSNCKGQVECGLPYIKACRNNDDNQISIFNKMAEEARNIQKNIHIGEAFKNNK